MEDPEIPELMLAAPVDKPPTLTGKAVEAKWDGLRCALLRGSTSVQLMSRRRTPLGRAFPDIITAAERDLPPQVLLDGEVVIWAGQGLDFGLLLQRMRSGPTTVARLARQTPASFVAFDLLHDGDKNLMPLPYRERRAALEDLFTRCQLGPPWTLCPMTTSREQAMTWLTREWAERGIEGWVIKPLSSTYRPGVRGWQKFRSRTTTEAVVGGITGRLARPETVLLGRFDGSGRLRYVGRTTPLSPPAAKALATELFPATPQHPWTGRRFTAGWHTREPLDVTLVDPTVVAEVSGDAAIDEGKWRHPLRFARPRPNMRPTDAPPFGAGNEAGMG
ncbi:ATP-dependent DNA ligase [Streptomyces sp. NPDC049555]|uniref:ATP-dependent DNA ligase n=1 Tax=Streptomyces sp. NPDC049555 TaxID=3154930 RepID=UPI0034299257